MSQWPYARPSKIRHVKSAQYVQSLLLGRKQTSRIPEKQNLDALSTFYGRKYGRLDVIQNPAAASRKVAVSTAVGKFRARVASRFASVSAFLDVVIIDCHTHRSSVGTR